MTIKELEERSGMSRSNIRFYEREGLLSPQRHDNNYRDYSEEDLHHLLRIRLLRSLELPLEEIRALQHGEKELDAALQEHLHTLAQQAQTLQNAQQVCHDIRRDGARYATLDAQHYLDAMQSPTAVPVKDSVPHVQAPWRRFFARHFDLMLYGTAWCVLGLLVLQKSPTTESGSAWFGGSGFMAILMMVIIEPLFLCTCGTTPGKWLLGLSVTDNTGQKLGYIDGLYRTAQALWHGLGFFIPIFRLIRGWRRYCDCTDGKTLAWEWDSELVLRDEKAWRVLATIGGVIVQVALIVLSASLFSRPAHQGDMTVAQFAESYNRQAEIREMDYRLDENGHWAEKARPNGVIVSTSSISPPNFVYREENGLMTGLTFSMTVEGDRETRIPLFTNRRLLAVYSFVQAYDPTPLSTSDINALVQKMAANSTAAATYELYGVRISWQLEHAGYFEVADMDCLWPEVVTEPYCTMIFTIEKVS